MANQTAQFNGEASNIESNLNKVHEFDDTLGEALSKRKYPSLKCLQDFVNKFSKGTKGDKGDPGDVNTLQMNTACSNALRGSASGEAVRLTDVSPLEHTLTVKLKNKNLFDISSVVGFQTIRDLTYQSYYGSVSEDKTVTCRYGAYGSGLVLKDWSKYLKAGTYTISTDCYYPTTANTVKYEITANLPQFGISQKLLHLILGQGFRLL